MRRVGVKNGSSFDVLVLVRVEQEPIKRHRGGDGACVYLGCCVLGVVRVSGSQLS